MSNFYLWSIEQGRESGTKDLDSYYTHLQKNNGKYCTNFANVYKNCQFLCVYNINLNCKYNVYIEIL